WVTESTRPFDIVNDQGFQCLMKTGRLDYYLPNPHTVSCDIRNVFIQAYRGELNFATDTWTAPNHRSFAAITVHLEEDGKVLVIPLDIVEVARSHTSAVLANEFMKVLEEFGVADKVRMIYIRQETLTVFHP
ncbi:hypothetical protein SCLCIDRAFT_145042, partial [Scleroderma citrinum Foug A]